MPDTLRQLSIEVWFGAAAVIIAATLLLWWLHRNFVLSEVELPFKFKFGRREKAAQQPLSSPLPPSLPEAGREGGADSLRPGREFGLNIGAQAQVALGGKLVGRDEITADNVVQAGDHATINIGVQTPPPPPSPTPGGYVPAQASEIYIERGDIETQVRERLRRGGVAAIVGVHAPGGVGKTELAKHAAHDLSAEFEKTLWLDVGKKTREQVIGALAVECHLEFKPDWDYGQRVVALKQFLQGRSVLIIFDDVRSNNAPSLTDFLPPSPPCAALITSRVGQLSAALPANATLNLGAMTPVQARQLLEAALTPARILAEAAAAEVLAERCKFNPLALTIAAKRIGLLSDMDHPIAFVAEKVHKRLAELKVGDDPRNDLFAVFDESYEALSADDARRFCALSVFAPTGFSPAAVARVWNEAQLDAEQALSRLLNLSLLKVVPGGTERYRLHDLLDEYAASKLSAAELGAANRAHAEFLIALFRKHSTIDPSTAPEVAPELDNLRAAANWTMEKREGNLLASLAYYPRNWLYNVFRINEEWLSWLAASLRFGIEERGLQANVLQAIGDVQSFRDERDAALESYRQALELFRAVGARLGEANVLQAIGDVQSFRKDNDAALESYRQALELFRAVGDRLGEANVLAALSRHATRGGDLKSAEQSLGQVIAIRRAIGALYDEGADYFNFSLALLNLGKKAEAKDYALKAKAVFEKLGEPSLMKQVEALIEAVESLRR